MLIDIVNKGAHMSYCQVINAKNSSRQFLSAFVGLVLCASLFSCSSKKKAEEENAASATPTQDVGGASAKPGGGAPAIENAPMSFDATGSDSGKIGGLYSINFDYDKNALSADAKEKLKSNADWLKSHKNMNLQIEGHCDSRGSIEYNLALGERRAQAVRGYMVNLGIPGNRLNIISYGKERPLATGDSEADHSRNRRANFVPIAQ